MIAENDVAPDFELPADDGSNVRLSELRGRKVILYFYPKDDTPGCTTEACEFRDIQNRVDEKDAVVLGVSPDPVESHQKFKRKYDLNFPLLADTEHEVAEDYGVWKQKQLFGDTVWGVERSTFVIDADGRIDKAMRKVKPEGHAEAVVEGL